MEKKKGEKKGGITGGQLSVLDRIQVVLILSRRLTHTYYASCQHQALLLT